ncbi:DegT/DnrJ/EryC1/StrS family aminotransferase [Azospirillum sp.]|uniref:DegT/DnrJ/EryC1/StrS family aminotransferase n=1 Tax=Azospirillum sp. TaxID=34012 RepID=UPI0026138C60|nr:DegT/DnrJ/EryC1/StrS family aminotransferase [Azospirillum sp.]
MLTDKQPQNPRPVRSRPMPTRNALGIHEEEALLAAIRYYRESGRDPSYQGHYEKLYTDAFVRMMGGGFADAVSTGTAAVFVALAALGLPAGSEVAVSPITDPGTLSAIILNGLRPRLIDTAPDSYNVDASQFADALSDSTRAAVIVHATGQPAPMSAIMEVARARGVLVVEDCSQAHGARVDGVLVGNFGDIAAYSTMNRKQHISGGSGGLVYTRSQDLHRSALAHADRGKPLWQPDLDERNPAQFLFPALNFNSDELACAIALASLERLQDTIDRRMAFLRPLHRRMRDELRISRPYALADGHSPFFFPVFVDPDRLNCSKTEFAVALSREGIDINPHYAYVACEWPWLQPYLVGEMDTPNARRTRDTSFNLFLNENYGEQEVDDIIAALKCVEARLGL